MIEVVVSDWSVVFYGNHDGLIRERLQKIFECARAHRIAVGSVGVFDVPRDPQTLVHVDLLHCGIEEVRQILRELQIPEDSVTFVTLPPPEDSDVNHSAKTNKRLRFGGL